MLDYFERIFEHAKAVCEWVPRLLILGQKQQRVDDSEDCFKIANRNEAEFFRQYTTIDETCIHYYTPEGNRQLAKWTERGEPHPKRAKTQQSAGKVMASIFRDAQDIICIDYLKKDQTINTGYYIDLLDQLKDQVTKKRPHLKK